MLTSRARQGIALPIVLLVAALVLSAFVTIAGVSAVATRAATTGERASIQALLIAESGLDTLAPRSVAAGAAPPTVFEVADLQTWLTQSGLATYQVGAGTAVLTVVAADPDPDRKAFTVRSRGALGSAQTDVMSEFLVSSTTRRVRVNVPAALTSYPVVITGNPSNISIEGVSIEDASGVIYDAIELDYAFGIEDLDPGPYRVQLTKDSEGLLVNGDFLVVDGRTFEVVSIDGRDLSLRQIHPDVVTGPQTIGPLMDQVKVGLAEAFSLGSQSFRVNNPERLYELGLIKVGDATGVIESIIGDLVTVVSWTGVPSGHRGTPIVSEVYGIYTADAYQAHNRGAATDSWVEYGTLPDPGAEGEDSLFFQTFGVTKEDFLSSVGAANTFARASDMPLPLTGQTVLVQDHNLQNAICGTGTVVIDGDAVYNAGQACPDGQDFRGILYVMGDLRMQGNVVLTGAVVVEGDVDAEPDDTVVQGSGNLGTRIAYDDAAVREAVRMFPSPGGLVRVAGTWRQ